jgi:hypothetical protein
MILCLPTKYWHPGNLLLFEQLQHFLKQTYGGLYNTMFLKTSWIAYKSG